MAESANFSGTMSSGWISSTASTLALLPLSLRTVPQSMTAASGVSKPPYFSNASGKATAEMVPSSVSNWNDIMACGVGRCLVGLVNRFWALMTNRPIRVGVLSGSVAKLLASHLPNLASVQVCASSGWPEI